MESITVSTDNTRNHRMTEYKFFWRKPEQYDIVSKMPECASNTYRHIIEGFPIYLLFKIKALRDDHSYHATKTIIQNVTYPVR
jgi:hypothetical protein